MSGLLQSLATGSPEDLNKALLKMIGKSRTFTSPSSVLDQGVPDKIRAEIWADRYIDFVLLLKTNSPYVDPDKIQEKHEKAKVEKVHTYLAWTKAFGIFHSVYIQKYPEQSQALLEYADTIRELYQRAPNGFGWREYDEKFRFRRQSTLCKWDDVDSKLWLKIASYQTYNSSTQRGSGGSHSYESNVKNNNFQTSGNKNFNNKNNKKQSGGKSSALFRACAAKQLCFRFQTGTCSGPCKYKHICNQCAGDHPPSQCAQGSNHGRNSKTSHSD